MHDDVTPRPPSGGHSRPTLTYREFGDIVTQVVDAIPPGIRSQLDNVTIETARHAPSDDASLLGLYEGVPLPERGFDYFGVGPDRIRIFYDTHVALRLPRSELEEEVRRTVLHEIAHHIGIDDERLHEIGWG